MQRPARRDRLAAIVERLVYCSHSLAAHAAFLLRVGEILAAIYIYIKSENPGYWITYICRLDVRVGEGMNSLPAMLDWRTKRKRTVFITLSELNVITLHLDISSLLKCCKFCLKLRQIYIPFPYITSAKPYEQPLKTFITQSTMLSPMKLIITTTLCLLCPIVALQTIEDQIRQLGMEYYTPIANMNEHKTHPSELHPTTTLEQLVMVKTQMSDMIDEMGCRHEKKDSILCVDLLFEERRLEWETFMSADLGLHEQRAGEDSA